MSQNGSHHLQQQPRPLSVEARADTNDTSLEESQFEDRSSSGEPSNLKKACVLIGSCLLQLPIWGRLAFISFAYDSSHLLHFHITLQPPKTSDRPVKIINGPYSVP